MIRVLIGPNEVYRLTFSRRIYSHLKPRHKLTKDGKRNPGVPLYETTAIIHLANAVADEPPVAQASAKQHHKDIYNPEASRVAALKQLLRSDGAFARVDRRAIWVAYWTRSRDNQTPKSSPVTPPSTLPAQMCAPTPASKADAPRPSEQVTPPMARVVGSIRGNTEGHRIVNFVASNMIEVTPKHGIPGWFTPGSKMVH